MACVGRPCFHPNLPSHLDRRGWPHAASTASFDDDVGLSYYCRSDHLMRLLLRAVTLQQDLGLCLP